MRYLTDRKRAEGKGASGRGTDHHWYMTVSAVTLAFLVPTFHLRLWPRPGRHPRRGAAHLLAARSPAILTGLVLFVAMQHFWRGAQMLVSDYWRGSLYKSLLMLAIGLGYLVMATGLYALVRIAL